MNRHTSRGLRAPGATLSLLALLVTLAGCQPAPVVFTQAASTAAEAPVVQALPVFGTASLLGKPLKNAQVFVVNAVTDARLEILGSATTDEEGLYAFYVVGAEHYDVLRVLVVSPEREVVSNLLRVFPAADAPPAATYSTLSIKLKQTIIKQLKVNAVNNGGTPVRIEPKEDATLPMTSELFSKVKLTKVDLEVKQISLRPPNMGLPVIFGNSTTEEKEEAETPETNATTTVLDKLAGSIIKGPLSNLGKGGLLAVLNERSSDFQSTAQELDEKLEDPEVQDEAAKTFKDDSANETGIQLPSNTVEFGAQQTALLSLTDKLGVRDNLNKLAVKTVETVSLPGAVTVGPIKLSASPVLATTITVSSETEGGNEILVATDTLTNSVMTRVVRTPSDRPSSEPPTPASPPASTPPASSGGSGGGGNGVEVKDPVPSLRGVVRLGGAVRGKVAVVAHGPDGKVYHAATLSDGTYTFDYLPPGTYTIVFAVDGAQRETRVVTIP